MRKVVNEQRSSDVRQAPQASPSTDLFSAYLDMFGAMQSAMLSSLTSASEPAAAPTPSSAEHAPAYKASEESWYRRPFETPMGDYMHGSGMFVPGGMFASFIETAAKTQTNLAMQMMSINPAMTSGLGWNNPAWAGMQPYAMPMFGPMFGMPFSGLPGPQAIPGITNLAAGMTGAPGLPTSMWPMQMWGMPSPEPIPGMPGIAPWGSPPAGALFFSNELGRAMTEFWSATLNMAPTLLSSMLEANARILGSVMTTDAGAKSSAKPQQPADTAPSRAITASYRSAGGHATSTIIDQDTAPLNAMRMMATLPMELGLSSLMMFTNFAGGATRRW